LEQKPDQTELFLIFAKQIQKKSKDIAQSEDDLYYWIF
jgi:hypothetical protein